MRARDFDTKLEVFSLTTKRGEYTALDAVYEKVNIIAADRVKNNGSRAIVVGEQYSSYTADYNIRDGNDVKEGWRVRDLESGVLYQVEARFHDRKKRMYTLKCIGVNPNVDTDTETDRS